MKHQTGIHCFPYNSIETNAKHIKPKYRLIANFGTIKNAILKKSLIFVALSVLLIGFIGVSCEDEEAICNNTQVPPLRCTFSYETKKTPDWVIFFLPEINDTLYNKKAVPSYLYIPLDTEKDSTWLYMTIRRVINKDTTFLSDAILIKYNPEMQLVNLECGYNFVFKNLQLNYTNNEIDSIVQYSSEINQKKIDHAKIYIN